MKQWIIAIILIPIAARAQDCSLKKETDNFSHITRLTTGFVAFNTAKGKASLSIDVTATDIDFFFLVPGDGKCFDEESAITINYDGDRLKSNFRNTGSMNCDGAIHFSFRNIPDTPPLLSRLSAKKTASIRITGSNKNVTELILAEEQKQLFIKMVNCIIVAAKTLLPKQ